MGFSKSKQSSLNESQGNSNSSNLAYPALNTSLSPVVSHASTGSNAIADLLGLNGGNGQNQAFDNFRNSSGYNFLRDQGIQGIEGNAAAKGLLGSGSYGKSIATYSNNLADNFLNSYLGHLNSLSNTGLGAAGVIANAGQVSNSQSTSKGTSSGSSTGFTFG
jgi:hypothetical protein